MKVRLGTRGSRLAMIQSEIVAGKLRRLGHEVELTPIVTEGDLRPIGMAAGEGVFVAAIAQALVAREVDIAVHSAKDVPLEPHPTLVIGAYPVRADPRDALITAAGGSSLGSLRSGATVGTDSPRRSGFLRALNLGLQVVPLHGNVDTRLRRLDEGLVDALVIAAAGVDRLGRGERIDRRLEPEVVAPAPGQGALAVQARGDDKAILEVLSEIDDGDVRFAVDVEREVLRATGGGCRAPVGALCTASGDGFELLVAGVNSDGSDRRIHRVTGIRDEGPGLAARIGRRLVTEVALR